MLCKRKLKTSSLQAMTSCGLGGEWVCKSATLLCVNKAFPKLEIDSIRPELGESIILKNLVFETNKSEILPPSFEELNKVVDYLIKNNKNKIELSGHTDNLGQEESNQKLSEARAKAVAEYLISNGINKDRIVYKGYGSTAPIATNETEEGKQQNRRVEFVIK